MSKKKHKLQKSPKAHTFENETDKAVYATLKYRAIFDYPMTYYQICTFLISHKQHSAEKIKESLNNLFRLGVVEIKNNAYFLAGHNTVNWTSKARESQQMLEKAHKIANYLKQIPWINLMAVTGSVASFNGAKNDDIDIFIITQTNRAWITRFFTVLILKALGEYRTEKDYAGKICPNIYVDEQNSEWKSPNQNVYIAHEIAMMHPIFDRQDYYVKFLKNNSWIGSHLANFHPSLNEVIIKKQKTEKSRFFDLLDWLLQVLQISYMKKHKTSEITKRGIIHFNKKDWSKKVLADYRS